jgi:hypothetical protein
MEVITKNDLILINELSSRSYTGNRLLSNASEQEKDQLKAVKTKLKGIAKHFADKYNDSYGPFESSVSTGNDIVIGGTSFGRIWSGIFKGAPNKQYAAQISFVMNPNEPCLNVGFYFGRASGHSLNKQQQDALGGILQGLANMLANTIENNNDFKDKYTSLFDLGFKSYAGDDEVLGASWIEKIKTKAKATHIYAKIMPDDFGVIERSIIDSYVAQIIFMMGAIAPADATGQIKLKPLTPEQRAKQAERNSLIGSNGELFVMRHEKDKLKALGIKTDKYPSHLALESMHYGYDILSLDENKNEIFIEVKTTTRTRKDPGSKKFYLSTNEYDVYSANKSIFKLYRVYDIEGDPEIEMVNLEKVTKYPDGYICEYK